MGVRARAWSLMKVLGKLKEVELDMSPKLNSVAEVLGGLVTIVGQYDNGAVVLKLRNPTSSHEENPIILPAPFHKENICGPILMVRMDEKSNPQPFTKSDFKLLKKKLSISQQDKINLVNVNKEAKAVIVRENGKLGLGQGTYYMGQCF